MDSGADAIGRGWSLRLPIKEQAASLFAAGDVARAQSELIGHLEHTRGACDRSVWYMLFDLYLMEHQQSMFDKLSEFFVQQFQVSPPPWVDIAREQASLPQVHGRNALVVTADLGDLRPEKARDVVQQGRQLGWLRLDLSRATLSGTVDERTIALERWYSLMQRIRHHRVKVMLMGEYGIMDELRQQIAGDMAAMPVAWQVLMEFLQWRGQESAHDALAIEYLERFEISPPGFENHAVLAIQPTEDLPPSDTLPVHDLLVLPAEATVGDIPVWMAVLDEAVRHHGVARIDASQLRRISFEAASLWARELSRRGWKTDQVVLLHPTELVITLLDIAGCSDWAQVQPRRR